MRLATLVPAAIGSLVVLSLTACVQADGPLMSRAPFISGDLYRCEDMIRSVNALRRLGKSEALKILSRHIRDNGPAGDPREEKKVFLLCRLLFINPKGWDRLKLGHPVPEINWNAAEHFPLFPIAVSDGVPFLLVQGYRMGGVGESPEDCVKACESLSLIPADLPEGGYAKAAQALVGSDEFQRLYSEAEDTKRMASVILRQTEHTPPVSEGRPSGSQK